MKPTIIWRHARENLKKCTLHPLEGRSDLLFYTYPKIPLPDLSEYVLLKVGAPELSAKDAQSGLFLIDATWNLAFVMERQLPQIIECRSLPSHYQTAYPRRQTGCPDASAGLASIEALYLAYIALGRDPRGLLDHYYWKPLFLQKNHLEP